MDIAVPARSFASWRQGALALEEKVGAQPWNVEAHVLNELHARRTAGVVQSTALDLTNTKYEMKTNTQPAPSSLTLARPRPPPRSPPSQAIPYGDKNFAKWRL